MPELILPRKYRQPSIKSGFARSAAEAEFPGVWRGMLGYWSLEVGHSQGTSVHNLGVRSDSAELSSLLSNRRFGGLLAVDLSGTDDITAGQGYVPNGEPLTTLARFTVSDVSSHRGFIWAGRTGNYRWYADSNLGDLRVRTGNVAFRSTGETLAVDTWYTFVGTSDGNVGNWYLDGRHVFTLTSTPEGPSTVNFKFGSSEGLFYLDGRLNTWGIWNRELTASEAILLSRDPLAPFRLRSQPVFVPSVTGAPIAGDATAVANTAGELTISHPVAGSATSVADTDGELTISHPVAGDSTAVANTAGEFAVVVSLAGTSTAVANTAGQLDITTPGGISGSSTAVAATAGSLTINAPEAISGASTAVADTDGALGISHPVAGTSTAVAATAGSLIINLPGAVSGSSTAVADTEGAFDISEPSLLAGSSTAVANTAGEFGISHPIAGVSTAVANTLGFIPVGTFTPQPCRITIPADSNPAVIVPDSNPTHKSTEC